MTTHNLMDHSARIAWAMEQPFVSFGRKPTDDDNSGGVLSTSSALIALLLEIRAGTAEECLIERAAAHLTRLMSEDGGAPFFSLAPYWCYCPFTASIAVAHETPAVWNRLSAQTREKLDFMMQAFAYILAFGTSDDNNYCTGPGMAGNFSKNWNPNYRLAMVTPILFVSRYLGGADALDRTLHNFSYDETIARFKKYGWERAIAEWTKEPPHFPDGTSAPSAREFMENGGTAYLRGGDDPTTKRLGIKPAQPAGEGKGVRVSYHYHGFRADQVDALFGDLLAFNYSGGAVVSSFGQYENGEPKAYILDKTKSPYESQDGMMLEFASGDGNGIRSSCSYTTHDFIMVCAAVAALETLSMYDLRANKELYAKACVGNGDYLYKYSHGYMSFSLGVPYESHETSGDVYAHWKSWWVSEYTKGN